MPDSCCAILTENHSYEVSEIVQLPMITQGLDRYLGWMSENTKPPEPN
jgi:uncharacterized protein involved in tolerance to divalent cations